MAEGRSSWWLHAVGGVTSNAAPLPHWLGAGFIRVLSGWIDPALAARLPFAALLAAVLLLTWLAARFREPETLILFGVAFSAFLGDLVGQIYALLVLTVAAAESAIGLAIIVVLFRNRASINVEELDELKG